METLAIKSGYTIDHQNDDHQMSPSIVPMIVKVICDGFCTVVPVTPETTCSDVIECCRDPGDECCDLIAVCPEYGECQLRETDHPLEILQRWGSGRLVLRYTMLSSDGKTYEKRNGMKEPDHFGETLPDGVQLTLSELREMACRQQAQIDSQHQLLAAKEQRLRYLKEQEARQQRVQAESERLRRLRDRVDAQELKLRKLRALRGQVDHQKQNNISLTSDLDSIRALFNEKEKELSLAVAKVEELTRQLEELRRGRNGTATTGSNNRDQHSSSASALELDKLRRELMYRNKLNEQQNQRLHQQREALTARQEEMSAIDKRISELQERLHKKRLLNQQLANQISAASHKAAYHQLVRLTGNDIRKQQLNNAHHPPPNGLSRGNIAAVEPYNHLPLRTTQSQQQQQQQQQQIKQELTYHPVYQSPIITNQLQHIKKDSENNDDNNKITNSYQQQQQQEFTVSKSDPKYQTLPYNTKFTVNLIPNRIIRNNDNDNDPINNNNNNIDNNKENIDNISTTIAAVATTTSMTVHSAPLNIVNKNIATPLNHQNDLIINNNNNNKTTITTTTTTYQKPISSVAPTSIQHSNILSNIYQTSSIKIQPVEPQTIANNNNNNNKIQSPSSLALSPPNGTSTPLNSTGEISIEKPALPPKPVIKPPPRQTTINNNVEESPQQTLLPPPMPSSEPPSEETKLRQEMIIKAKPLTIKKQQHCEQPRLRSNLKLNQSRFNFGEQQQQPSNDDNNKKPSPSSSNDEIDKIDETPTQLLRESSTSSSASSSPSLSPSRRCLMNNNNNNNHNRKGNLKMNKTSSASTASRRVSFDPLALLLDASLEGELELVKKTAQQVPNPSAANDEGITALHNAICAGHLDIVQYLVNFGCDVNAQDSDGWTPLHCAASCNNVAMVKFLVEHGACIFATTLSDHETAAEKCEEDEEGFDGCSEYLYSVQEKLGILSGGVVYAVFDYTAQQPDELSFKAGQLLTVLRKGDENEREWWWSKLGDKEGYVPRNLLGLYPRVNRRDEE